MPIHAQLDDNGLVTHRLICEEGREPEGFLDGAGCNVGDTWDGSSFIPAEPEPVTIVQMRAEMRCTPLQGRLALGETVCAAIDAMAADPLTPWAMRQTITQASEWGRTSQAMDELGYLLGYTPEQMDALFVAAMAITV